MYAYVACSLRCTCVYNYMQDVQSMYDVYTLYVYVCIIYLYIYIYIYICVCMCVCHICIYVMFNVL